jgi:hypothetical protein
VKVTNPDGQSGTLLRAFVFESDTVSLSLPNTGGAQWDVVQVPINAANVAGLAAADFTVTFNASVLRGRGARPGSLTSGWSLAVNTNTAGQLRLSLANPGAPVSGDGTIALIELEVIGAPGSSSPLQLANVSLNSGAMKVQAQDGTFAVALAYKVTGNTRFWNGGRVVSGVQLTLEGDRVFSGQSDATGAYTVPGAPTGRYVLTPVKSDQVAGISAFDASLVLQHAVGLTNLTGSAAMAGDVDKSGRIDAMDAFYILQKSVQLIELPFPGAGVVWDFSPPTRSYPSLNTDLSGQDFTAILLGDVSGNWGSGGGAGLLSVDQGPAVATASALHDPSSSRGDEALTSNSAIGNSSRARVEPRPPGSLPLPNANPQSAIRNPQSEVTVGLRTFTTRSGETKVWLLVKATQPVIYSVDVLLDYDSGTTKVDGVQAGPLGQTLAMASNTNQPGVVKAAMAGAIALQGVGGLLVLSLPQTQVDGFKIKGISINEGAVPVEIDSTGAAFDADSDGDRHSDWEEIRAGTDPENRQSVFAIKGAAFNPDMSRTVTWAAVPGKVYQLQFKNSVLDAAWMDAGGEVVASGTSASQNDLTASQSRQRIYRVVLVE